MFIVQAMRGSSRLLGGRIVLAAQASDVHSTIKTKLSVKINMQMRNQRSAQLRPSVFPRILQHQLFLRITIIKQMKRKKGGDKSGHAEWGSDASGENLYEQIEQALGRGGGRRSVPKVTLTKKEPGLADDFDFFVRDANLDLRQPRDPTMEDCRVLYHHLRELLEQMQREKSELETNRSILGLEKTETSVESVKTDPIDWKAKYDRLKARYDELRSRIKRLEKKSPRREGPTPLVIPMESPQSPARDASKRKSVKASPKPREKAPVRIVPTASSPIKLDDRYPLDFDFDPGPPIGEEEKKNGRIRIHYRNGVTGTVFRNGNKKIETSRATYFSYTNGDVGIEFPDGGKAYRYAEPNTVELAIPGGPVTYLFEDGQLEKHWSNGEKEICLADGRMKKIVAGHG
jgi:hypothetical protein